MKTYLIKDILDRRAVQEIVESYGNLLGCEIKLTKSDARVYSKTPGYDESAAKKWKRCRKEISLGDTDTLKLCVRSRNDKDCDKAADTLKIILERMAKAGYEKVKLQERIEHLQNNESVLKKANDMFKNLSEIDSLTGLYNHRVFENKLLQYSKTEGVRMCIISGDANNLKIMNDMFGHEAGDRMLQTIAGKMRELASEKWIVARCGGDEFNVILPEAALSTAKDYCERVVRRLKNNIDFNIPLSIAFGAAEWEPDKESLLDCFKRADDLMYQNKKEIKRQEHFADYIIDKLFEREYIYENVVDKTIDMAGEFAAYLGLGEDMVDKCRRAAKYQDIGYIQLPEHFMILGQSMTQEGKALVRQHTIRGYELALKFDNLRDISDIILHAHENWDGNGYPEGKSGKDVPLGSRVIHLTETYNYWTTEKKSGTFLTAEAAIERLRTQAGEIYDPGMVERFVEFLEQKSED